MTWVLFLVSLAPSIRTLRGKNASLFSAGGGILICFDRGAADRRLQDPLDHVSATVSEIDPVLANLGDLVRSVRAAQAAFRQEGSYWEHRQKILQDKNAGRSTGPSGLPSPSPSRASDESPSSSGYPDRSTRQELYSNSSDKGKSAETASRSAPTVPDFSAYSTSAGQPDGKIRTLEGTRQKRSATGQMSVACPSDRLKAKLDTLVAQHFHDEDWMETVDDRIYALFDEDSLKAMFTCSCTKCRLARRLAIASSSQNGEGLQLDGMGDALRLLAMCILASKPFLIAVLLARGVDDDSFDDCRAETHLVEDTGIALEDARTLLRLKGLFFGVGITQYLRSSKKDDKPEDAERTWMLNELLELTRRLSSPNDPSERELQVKMVGQLTFTTTRKMATDRKNDVFPELWDDQMSLQSLGYLVIDMIWFLVGGSAMVKYMDELRLMELQRQRTTSRNTPYEWIKAISKDAFQELESEAELAQAFEVAYILIQPNGRFGLDGTTEENYIYADAKLRKLWPVSFLEYPVRDHGNRPNRSLDVWSISTRGSAEAADGGYVEMEEDVFKWL